MMGYVNEELNLIKTERERVRRGGGMLNQQLFLPPNTYNIPKTKFDT